MMEAIRRLALTLVVVAALSGCGGSGNGSTTAPATAAPPKAGELDATFGNGGIASVPASPNSDLTTIGNAGVQGADQRVWVVGAQRDYSNPRLLGSSAAMARFRADGSLDASLSTGPVNASANVAIDRAPAGMVVTYESGSTCVAGTCVDWTAGLASIDETGAPNGAFTSKSVFAFQPRQVFPDGAGGSFLLGTSNRLGRVLTRIDAGGREDTSYAANASAASRCDGSGPAAIAPAGGGRLLAATSTSQFRTCITRLNADGTLDTTFGSAGHAFRDEANPTSMRFILVAPDQTILVVASTFIVGMNLTLVPTTTWVLRLSPAGIPLDASPLPADPIVDARAIAMQPDGRLLVAGYSHYDRTNGTDQPVLVRLDKTGSRDVAFGSGGTTSLTASSGALQPSQVFVGVDGRIYVVGSLIPDASAPWRTQMAVARFGA